MSNLFIASYLLIVISYFVTVWLFICWMKQRKQQSNKKIEILEIMNLNLMAVIKSYQEEAWNREKRSYA